MIIDVSAHVCNLPCFNWCFPPDPLQEFADRYRLRITRDTGEVLIQGKRGHFYADGGGIGIAYLGDDCTARGKKALLAAGPAEIQAEGDEELLLLPGKGYDFGQAIRVLGLPRVRTVSDTRRRELRADGRKTRFGRQSPPPESRLNG